MSTHAVSVLALAGVFVLSVVCSALVRQVARLNRRVLDLEYPAHKSDREDAIREVRRWGEEARRQDAIRRRQSSQ
jgi:hypothetical protein